MLPTKDDLKKRYQTFPDDRLLEIVYNKHEYTADALEVAEAEIALRKITDVQVRSFVAEKKVDEEERLAALAIASKIPLVLWEKLFFFFIWFSPFFLGRGLRANYAEDGMTLKLLQSKVLSILGFTNVLFSFFVTDFFNIPDAGPLLYFALAALIFVFQQKIYTLANRITGTSRV